MADDDYKKRFDEIIKLIPNPGTLTSANNKLHLEYYGEVHSGAPALVRPGLLPKTAPPELRLQNETKREEVRAKWATGAFTNAAAFTTLADNMTHTELVRNWAGGGIKTSCNAFVGYVTKQLGLSGLGGFNVEKILAAQGKQHCWLTTKSGETPRYGDLFETRSMNVGYENLHVGFSLSVEGEVWKTVEGGQGGPVMGVDRICRVKKTYSTTNLLGWVDMRMLLSGAQPLPDWLIGDWMVSAGAQTWIYSFDRLGTVRQKAWLSPTNDTAVAPVRDTGAVGFAGSDIVQLKWNGEGGIETFRYDRFNSFPGLREQANVQAQDGTGMKAIRL